MDPQFDDDKLMDCLNDTANFSKKYKEFKEQFSKINQQFIHGTISILKDVLTAKNNPPMRKIHALRAIKQGLQVCQYGFIILVQIEIMPILKQIGLYKKGQKQENRGKSYFLQTAKDVKQKQQYQKYGNSYLKFVLEIIEIWAKIKPYYVYQDLEIQEFESQFVKVYKQLKSQNVVFPSSYSYFKPTDTDNIRKKFQTKLESIFEGREKYQNYYQDILLQCLDSQQHFTDQFMDHLKKLYKFGQQFVICKSLKVIQSILLKKCQPQIKIYGLRLFNYLFKLGEIQVMQMSLNIVDKLVKYIDNIDPNDKSIKRGEKLFPQDTTKKYGNIYYRQLCKTIKFFASCMEFDPFSPQKLQSNHKKALVYLRDTKKYEFPEISQQDIKKYKSQFHSNTGKNNQRNKIILQLKQEQQQINQKNPKEKGQSKLPESSTIKQEKKQQIKKSSKQQQKPQIFTIPKLETQKITERYKTLKKIHQQFLLLKVQNQKLNSSWLQNALNYMKNFNNTFEDEMKKSLEQQLFDQICNQGYDHFQLIQQITTAYQQYNTKKINYSNLLNKFKNLLEIKNNTPGGENKDFKTDQQKQAKNRKQNIDSEQKQKKRLEQLRLNDQRKKQQELKKIQQQNKIKEELEKKKRAKEQADKIQQKKKKQFEQLKKQDERKQQQQQLNRKRQLQRMNKLAEEQKKRKLEQQQLRKKLLEQQKRKILQQQQKKKKLIQQEQLRKRKLRQQQQQLRKRKLKEQEEIRQRKLKEQQEQLRKRKLKEQEQLRQRKLKEQEEIRQRKLKEQQEQLRKRKLKEQEEIRQRKLKEQEEIRQRKLKEQQEQLRKRKLKEQEEIRQRKLKEQEEIRQRKLKEQQEQLRKRKLKEQEQQNAKRRAKQQSQRRISQQLERQDQNKLKQIQIINQGANIQNFFLSTQIMYKQHTNPNKHILKSNQLQHQIDQISQIQIEPDIPVKKLPANSIPQNTLFNSIRLNKSKQESKPQLNNKFQLSQSIEIQEKNILPQKLTFLNQQKSQQKQDLRFQVVSQINQPLLEPLNDSFYQFKQIEKDKKQNGQNLSFKKVFATDKFLLPHRSIKKRKQKIFWIEQDTKLLNPIPSTLKSDIKNINSVTFPELLAERAQQYSEQVRNLQIRYKKQIQSLQQKIYKLELQASERQSILNDQRSQIQSLRQTLSQRDIQSNGKNTNTNFHQVQYLQHQNLILKNKLQKKNRFYETSFQSMSPFSHTFQNSLHDAIQKIKQPKGKIFSSQPYFQYIRDLKDPKTKKNMLKNKQLLFKSNEIQIGSIVSKDNILKIALFIQSQKHIKDLRFQITHFNNLIINKYPQVLPDHLIPLKQQKIIISIDLPSPQNIPFQLPIVELSYKINGQSFLNKIILPCSFNRFVDFKQIEIDEFKKNFKAKKENIIRGQEIAYNKKVLKDYSAIKQYIPRFTLLNILKQQEFIQGKCNMKFGCMINYQKYSYLLRLNIKPHNFLYFQAVSIQQNKSVESNKIIEFLICNLNSIFCRQKSWF